MIEFMVNPRDRILIVESDPVISDLIGRQALQASGFQVFVATDATTAIAKALQWAPDLIITDLNLPGLSGKDLMVALSSQGVNTPVILLAQRGTEADIIQTFRLGASDYLLLPLREAEVIAAVNRVLQQVHDRRERDRLAQQLQQTNHELQARVRELTTIFAIGKAMTSVTDQSALLEKILDGALRVTQADLGWFLLRDDTNRPFAVAAEHGLPPALGVRLNQPWDDGISSLVAMSGESLSIHGEPLKRFKIFSLGLAALIVPIKVQKKVVGLLVMMRKQPALFGASEQHLLEALADYASISMVNAHLFRALEERARSFQHMADSAHMSGKINNEILQAVKKEVAKAVSAAGTAFDQLAKDPTAHWRSEQRQQLALLQDQLHNLAYLAEAVTPMPGMPLGRAEKAPSTSLPDQVRQSARRLQGFAQQNSLSLVTELSPDPLVVCVEAGLVAQMVDSLLASTLRFTREGGLVTLHLEKSAEQAHGWVRSSALSLDPKSFEKMLEEPEKAPAGSAAANKRFNGLTLRLSLLKEIAAAHRGKVWLESLADKETVVHFALPLAR